MVFPGCGGIRPAGVLLDFWRGREEGEFAVAQSLPIRFVRFCAPDHDKVVVISTGRIENYVKYPAVAYDLFQCGYDVMIIDHPGHGLSGRFLADSHRGHVLQFADYVSDFDHFLATVWPTGRLPPTLRANALHRESHIGAVSNLETERLTAPAAHAQYFHAQRSALSSQSTVLRRLSRAAAGRPTYHCVLEGMLAGQQVITQAEAINTPVLLKAGEEKSSTIVATGRSIRPWTKQVIPVKIMAR